MNYFQRILSLLCIFGLVAICSAGDPNAFSVFTGKFISIEPAVSDESETSDSAPTDAPPIEPVDFSNAVLTISYDTTNAEGETETLTLYEGAYEEEFMHVLQNQGIPVQFSEPTEIKISLQLTEESDPMEINAVIETGLDVDFVYIDHPGTRDEFVLFGSSNQVINPENKFTITGDLSFLELESPHTTSAFAWATFINAEGEPQSKQWGPVLVKDGSFLIEGDVERPITASLYVRNQSKFYSTSTDIVLEPKGELKVTKLGSQTREIALVSGTGYHAQVIESWQQHENYIALVENWTAAQERASNPPDETADEITESSDEPKEDADSDEEESTETEESTELVESIAPAEGCEDAVAQEEPEIDELESVEPAATYEPPYWYTQRMKAMDFRKEKLQAIALNSKDPNAQLLAMKMNNVFSPYDDAEKALSVWQSLALKFDKEFVATYITPEMERVELVHTRTLNDEALVPGQKVPAFTLASLEGEDVSIYDFMAEKDMVLIDFWASWCGPCIATFPDLKKLHAAYTDENFEIVGVSVDSNFEDWSGGVEDHQLPWVQLGELKDADNGTPVSKSYGVNFIPKTFLVDSQGCIYRKNIHPSELKTFLVDRYGMDESLKEPEVETEDTPEVSS